MREDKEAEEQEDFGVDGRKEKTLLTNGSLTKDLDSEAKQKAASMPKPQSQKSTASHGKAASLDIPKTATPANSEAAKDVPTSGKRLSLSPGRAAHFSAQPVYETPDGVKHQPPARSVSPAKSALKYSPSRGMSPITGILNHGRGPASEASDTTSVISDEGMKAAPSRKKSVRVSFDNDSVAVGRAATPPTDTESPVIMSPQATGKSGKKWLGFGKETNKRALSPNRDNDAVIQPTPVLPSFGSVRERGEKATPKSEKPKSKPQSSQTKVESPDTTGLSSDQRVGGILSRVFTEDLPSPVPERLTAVASNEPLPPEVTSVEGTGYHSDSGNSIDLDRPKNVDTEDTSAVSATMPTENAQAAEDVDAKAVATEPAAESPEMPEQNMAVPSIAVQPASPRPEDTSPTVDQQSPAMPEAPTVTVQPATPGPGEMVTVEDNYWVHLPGGFPTSTDASDIEHSSMFSVVDHKATDPTPADVGIAEPEPEAAAAQHDAGSPVVGEVAEGLRLQTEPDVGEDSEDGNDSIYSDAAEDMSDLEGDGFGSINAIVESPAAAQVPFSASRAPESPTQAGVTGRPKPSAPLVRNDSELSEPGPDAGWDKAQAYWAGLSQSRKQQIERAAAPASEEASVEPIKSKPRKKKTIPKKSADGTGQKTDKNQLASQPAQAPAMKKSMRAPSAETTGEPQRRQPGPMKKSMRNSQPPDTETAPRMTMQKKQRPMSALAGSEYDKVQLKPLSNGHDRAVSLGGATKAANISAAPAKKTQKSKPLSRTISNDSDSSSSFRKSRPKTPEGGRYSMRRSMRGSSVDERPQATHGRSTSLVDRTSSPAGGSQRRPFSSIGPGASAGVGVECALQCEVPWIPLNDRNRHHAFRALARAKQSSLQPLQLPNPASQVALQTPATRTKDQSIAAAASLILAATKMNL